MELIEKEIDLSKIKLAIGVPIFGNPCYPFMESLYLTRDHLQDLGVECEILMDINNPYIDLARNVISDKFMRGDFNRIFWIDHDMGWSTQDVTNLLYWSTKYDFVSGMYPLKREPVSYKLDMPVPIEKDKNGLIKAKGVPIGFTVINKTVFAKMNPGWFLHEEKQLRQYFRAGPKIIDGASRFIGEDIYFCKEYGGNIWIDPEVNPVHYGMKGYKGNFGEMATNKFGVKL